MSVTPIPEGWCGMVEIARRVKVPGKFAKRCLAEGIVDTVRVGNRVYGDPLQVAACYVADTANWRETRVRVAKAAGLPEPPPAPGERRGKLGEKRCALPLDGYKPKDHAFIETCLRLRTCPTVPRDAQVYVDAMLSARAELQSEGRKVIVVGRGRPRKIRSEES